MPKDHLQFKEATPLLSHPRSNIAPVEHFKNIGVSLTPSTISKVINEEPKSVAIEIEPYAPASIKMAKELIEKLAKTPTILFIYGNKPSISTVAEVSAFKSAYLYSHTAALLYTTASISQ